MFVIKTDDVPNLKNYEAALEHYKKTKAFTKGRYRGQKPLGKRTKPNMRITRSPTTDAVACVLYGTEVVVFYPDNTVELSSGGWVTQSTLAFIRAILDLEIATIDDALVTKDKNGLITKETETQNLKFKISLTDYFMPMYTAHKDNEVVYHHKLKQKTWRERRKKLRPLVKHLGNMMKLSDPKDYALESKRFAGFQRSVYLDNVFTEKAYRREFYEVLKEVDLQAFGKFIPPLLEYAAREEFNCDTYGTSFRFEEYRAIKMMYYVVKLYESEKLFRKVKATKLTKDPNKGYIE